MKGLERSRTETWVQTERDVCSQFRFMIPKLENHINSVSTNLISEINTHLQRIFALGKIIRCNSVFQRGAALVANRSGEMPCLCAKETVGAALDFMAAVETPAVLQPMKIITHDRGVIRPALSRRCHIIVAVKKANPLAGFIDSRH